MDEKVDAATSHQQTAQQTPIAVQPTFNAAPNQPAPNSEEPDKPDKISKSDWVMIMLTVFIAAGTIASAGAIILQWREMVSGGADTTAIANAAKIQACAAKQIAEASKRNATAAEGFATSANGIKKAMNAAVAKLDAQAKATEKGRETSDASAQSALKATLDDFRLEQRPWVGISISNNEIVPTPGTKPIFNVPAAQVTVSAHNTGRTPAVFLQVFCCKEQEGSSPDMEMPSYDELDAREVSKLRAFFENKALSSPPNSALLWREQERERIAGRDHDQGKDASSGEVIPPDGYRELKLTSMRNIEGNDVGRTFAYFMGKFLYRDVLDSSKVHTTYFCLMQFRSSGFELCKHGQDMK